MTPEEYDAGLLESWALTLRKAGWTVKPPGPGARIEVNRDGHDTSYMTVAKMNVGTFREELLWLFIAAETRWDTQGWTDDELEEHTGRAHTTVSAARNVLARKGLVYPSEERRLTRAGNKAIVWRRTNRQAMFLTKEGRRASNGSAAEG